MIHVKKLDHISVATPRWRTQLPFMERLFGVKFLHEFKPSPGFPFGGCTTQVYGTNIEWELLEPENGQGFVQRFLDERGPGIHHLCLEVDDIDATAAELERLGIDPMGGVTQDSMWRMTFIHPRDAGGVLYQLFEPLPTDYPDRDRTASQGTLKLNRMDHVSLATPDLDRQVEWQSRVLGMEVQGRWQDDYLGYRAAIMSIPGSDLQFEIIQPGRSDSFVQKFLDERGPGAHHVCCEVESVEGAAEALRAEGIEPFGGIIQNGWKKHTFVHPRDSGGVLFQLFEEPGD